MMMRIFAVLILATGLSLAEEPPVIPVSVQAQAGTTVFKQGKPLLMSVTLTNGLSKTIRFSTFATEPNKWNGETFNISLVDVYRNRQKRNLYLERPKIDVPPSISGPGAYAIQPSSTFHVMLDISKWKIEGGWTKGEYELVFRMDNIIVDDKVTLSILSDPVHVRVQ